MQPKPPRRPANLRGAQRIASAALVAALAAHLGGILLLAVTCMAWPAQAATLGHVTSLVLFPVLTILLLRSRRR